MTRPNRPTAPGGGLYAISVAAELVGTGQQNIRLYETPRPADPGRTAGGTRQYSDADIAVLRPSGNCWNKGSTWPAWQRFWNWRRPTPVCAAALNARAQVPGALAPSGTARRRLIRVRLPPAAGQPVRILQQFAQFRPPSTLESRTSTSCGERSWCGVQKYVSGSVPAESLALGGLDRQHAVFPDARHQGLSEPGRLAPTAALGHARQCKAHPADIRFGGHGAIQSGASALESSPVTLHPAPGRCARCRRR